MTACKNAIPYLQLDDETLLAQCEVDCYRASGPGGQKRNKTSSAVRFRHRPTGLMAIANEDRSQHVNRRRALRRIRETIALNIRTEIDPKTYQPSPLLQECLGPDGALRVGFRDARHYLVICELLDIVASCRGGMAEAAKLFNLSTGRFTKLLRRNPKLWARVNEIRQTHSLKLLR